MRTAERVEPVQRRFTAHLPKKSTLGWAGASPVVHENTRTQEQ
jgi:hypothetical protein